MRDKRLGLKKRNIVAVLCLVLAALSLALIAASVAKYSTSESGEAHGVIPADFRLECTPYANGYTYIVPEGTQSITFGVDSTHKFTVKCDEGQAVEYANNTDAVTPVSIAANTWAVDTTHTVTVATTAPYAKTITFSFKVVTASAANYYKIVNKTDWVELTLYIGSTPPNGVTVKYGTLAPDNLNALMTGWMTAAGTGEITAGTLQPYSQYTLIFFGKSTITSHTDKQSLVSTAIDLIPAQNR